MLSGGASLRGRRGIVKVLNRADVRHKLVVKGAGIKPTD